MTSTSRHSVVRPVWLGVAVVFVVVVAGVFVWRPGTGTPAPLTPSGSAPETMELTAVVNDFAGIISPAREAEMDSLSRKLLAATGDVLIVATIRSFRPFADIGSYAREMFKNHGKGIGQAGRDNGLLIVIAIDDRQVRVEVGYGLEKIISNDYADQTIRETMMPYFRKDDYESGVLAGAERCAQRLAQARGTTLQ